MQAFRCLFWNMDFFSGKSWWSLAEEGSDYRACSPLIYSVKYILCSKWLLDEVMSTTMLLVPALYESCGVRNELPRAGLFLVLSCHLSWN